MSISLIFAYRIVLVVAYAIARTGPRRDRRQSIPLWSARPIQVDDPARAAAAPDAVRASGRDAAAAHRRLASAEVAGSAAQVGETPVASVGVAVDEAAAGAPVD